MRIPLLICLLAAVVASGCTMAPHYERPQIPVDAAWPDAAKLSDEEKAAANAADKPWREFLTDPAMAALVELGLKNNRDLRIALLNVEKVRAQYWIQRADLLPTINASAASSAQYLNKAVSGTGEAYIARQYTASIGFTAFELDLFGRIRSLKDSALEQFYATEEDARSTQTTLVAEIAGAYLQLVADRELLALSRSTYENRKDSYALAERMFEQGLSSQLTVNQAKTLLEEARVAAVQYETRAAQDLNSLVMLLGSAIPEDITLAEKLSEVQGLPDLTPGLPSDLLLRRPDILSAEHQLLSANANIGAARANFFPSISITSSIGTIAPQYHDLFSKGGGTWLFQPQAVLPIFDTGRNYAQLKVSEKDKEIAVASYEKAIQSAFREVADALAQRGTIGEQLAAQRSLLDATQQTYDLSQKRYDLGMDSYLTLLDAQRSLFSAQQSMVNTSLLRETNLLTLYKALGGGWQ